MKIIIVKYPCEGYGIGDVADFGPEKNASLVELQRAVWAEPPKPKKFAEAKKPSKTEEPRTSAGTVQDEEEPQEEKPDPKKFKSREIKKKEKMLVNELGEKIQEKKDGKRASFWDKLK